MTGPHQDQPIETVGPAPAAADAAVVTIHGRGATARSILELSEEFDIANVAYLAPQAAGNAWYPRSFLAPVASNEPHLSSALAHLEATIEQALTAGISRERVLVLGFSQGACLASEFLARNPARYGGLVGLSGGLIGETVDESQYSGSLAGTPVFLGCSDSDPHIPESRVHETATVLESLDAEVTTEIYPGMGHGVNEDELAHVEAMIQRLP